MAIPTITSISPSQGLTTGLTLVELQGTGFRVAPSPPPTGYEGTDWQQTVRVLIDGVEADQAMAVSDELCWVVVPEYLGAPEALPKTCDLSIQNLDDNGDPIATEEATEVGAYTYHRQDLTAEGALEWTCDQLIGWFQRHMIYNVALTTDPDYTDNPAAGVVALAELPGIVLVGPRVSDDPIRQTYQEIEHPIDGHPDVARLERARIAKELEFTVHLFGRTKAEALNMQEQLENAWSMRPYLRTVEFRGSSNTIDLTMILSGDWNSIDESRGGFTRRTSTTLTVQGVKLRSTHGVESDPQVAPGQPVAYKSGEDALDLTLFGGIE